MRVISAIRELRCLSGKFNSMAVYDNYSSYDVFISMNSAMLKATLVSETEMVDCGQFHP